MTLSIIANLERILENSGEKKEFLFVFEGLLRSPRMGANSLSIFCFGNSKPLYNSICQTLDEYQNKESKDLQNNLYFRFINSEDQTHNKILLFLKQDRKKFKQMFYLFPEIDNLLDEKGSLASENQVKGPELIYQMRYIRDVNKIYFSEKKSDSEILKCFTRERHAQIIGGSDQTSVDFFNFQYKK